MYSGYLVNNWGFIVFKNILKKWKLIDESGSFCFMFHYNEHFSCIKCRLFIVDKALGLNLKPVEYHPQAFTDGQSTAKQRQSMSQAVRLTLSMSLDLAMSHNWWKCIKPLQESFEVRCVLIITWISYFWNVFFMPKTQFLKNDQNKYLCGFY